MNATIQREKEDYYTMFGLVYDPKMQCNTKNGVLS